jgi:hypothetical protein
MNLATVSRDLTAQKLTEAKLQQLNATLEQQVLDRIDGEQLLRSSMPRSIFMWIASSRRLQQLGELTHSLHVKGRSSTASSQEDKIKS